jgi:hypothetical protein
MPPLIVIKKEFLLNIGILLAIYISLEFYYSYYISDTFEYMGYVPDLNITNYLITKITFISLLVLSYTLYKKNTFLYAVYLLLVFFFFLPVAILFSFSNFANGPFVATTFFICCFALSPYILFSIPDRGIPDKWKPALLLSISLLLFVPIACRYGIAMNLKTLRLSEIYETRQSFSESMDGWLNYFYHIEAKTLIPVTLIFFMLRKQYAIAVLCFFLLLYLYVISGNKLVYFTSIAVVFFYCTGRTYSSKINNFFFLLLLLFAAFPLIDIFILPEPILAGTFVNRFLFIPALLTNFYFDFFNGHPFYFAETNLFNHFVKSPYDMEIGFLITREYWGAPMAYANNGIVSDGFMNLGYLGVLVFSFAFTALFGLFNSLKLHKGYFGVYFSYVFLILSTPFLGCILGGGILVFIILGNFVLRASSQNKLHTT